MGHDSAGIQTPLYTYCVDKVKQLADGSNGKTVSFNAVGMCPLPDSEVRAQLSEVLVTSLRNVGTLTLGRYQRMYREGRA